MDFLISYRKMMTVDWIIDLRRWKRPSFRLQSSVDVKGAGAGWGWGEGGKEEGEYSDSEESS